MRKVFYSKFQGLVDGKLDTELVWPKEGQKLFKEPTTETPSEVSAHLDWLQTFNDDLAMPEAYRESGDFLVEALYKGGDGTHPDRFLFPILYLYRHSIELKLKEIINLGIKLDFENADSVKKITGRHSLLPLWDSTRNIIEKRWTDIDVMHLDIVESVIKDFDSVDEDGQHLRYSKTKDGSPYNHNMPPIIDLLNTRYVMEGVFNFLDGTIDGLMDAISNIKAALSDNADY